MPSASPCLLRADATTGQKGVQSQEPAPENHYNHNFINRFCGCGVEYDAHQEKGTMFQCLGLGTEESGGCGEDWWHPQCLLGLPRDWQPKKELVEPKVEAEANGDAEAVELLAKEDEEHPTPPGFPDEEDFESMLCYKCVDSNPWIKQYAGTSGFLPAVYKQGYESASTNVPDSAAPIEDENVNVKANVEELSKESAPAVAAPTVSRKRKASDAEEDARPASPSKRVKEEAETKNSDNTHLTADPEATNSTVPRHKHDDLPPAPTGTFSLFMKEDFRDHLCHCPRCYVNLIPHPQLVEEEDTHEPPLSESGDSNAGPGSSKGTGSILEWGEAALNNVDRVRAIEGVMVYNNLKDKVKEFLKPYAESGQAVGADDIKAYFDKLRGDDIKMKEALLGAGGKGGGAGDGGDNRKEQGGY